MSKLIQRRQLLIRFVRAFVASDTAAGSRLRETFEQAHRTQVALESLGFDRDDLQAIGRAAVAAARHRERRATR